MADSWLLNETLFQEKMLEIYDRIRGAEGDADDSLTTGSVVKTEVLRLLAERDARLLDERDQAIKRAECAEHERDMARASLREAHPAIVALRQVVRDGLLRTDGVIHVTADGKLLTASDVIGDPARLDAFAEAMMRSIVLGLPESVDTTETTE